MNQKWKSVIEKFLNTLEATQLELKALYQTRKTALIGGDLEKLGELQSQEKRITNQFQKLLKVREQILKSAIHEGFKGNTLRELVKTSEEENNFLLQRINKSEELTETLRQESWVQWIIANRNFQYVTDVISLIAHKGQKPLTYTEQDANESIGGTFLDASA